MAVHVTLTLRLDNVCWNTENMFDGMIAYSFNRKFDRFTHPKLNRTLQL
jgi:hypothetical protein